MRTLFGFGRLAAVALLTAGCTWVDTTPQGEKVRVLAADEVTRCERVGHTNVSVKASVAGVNRSREKVQGELDTLARNSAPDLGGDTVVRASPVEAGRQTYDVYRCLPR
jgi:hypothetical protein